jgi:hypothetical protein
VVDSDEREAAIASTEETCPRCGASRAPGQEYCVECGLRLPPVSGVIPALRRRWIRRFGWYPGDWVWTSALTFLIAAAGAAVAIALTSGSASGGGATFVVITNSTSNGTTTLQTTTAATTTLPAAPEPTVTTQTKTTATTRPATTAATTTAATTTTATTTKTVTTPAPPPNGQTAWPSGHSGWTLVLTSYPVTGGRAPALATAHRAAKSGLPQVGILSSSAFGSLHPGYYVVFSGIYDSQAQADAAAALARARGFSGAYSRQISR